MPGRWKRPALSLLKFSFILAPWLLSMYLLYWLDRSQTWSPETPHRGKLSVTILVIGMGLSFLLYAIGSHRTGK